MQCSVGTKLITKYILREDQREPFRKGTETNRNICLAVSQLSFVLFVGNNMYFSI